MIFRSHFYNLRSAYERCFMFIEAADLAELTGYVVPAYQCRWLDRHGYPFELSRAGKPKVLKAYVEKRLGLTSASVTTKTEPDFSRWAR